MNAPTEVERASRTSFWGGPSIAGLVIQAAMGTVLALLVVLVVGLVSWNSVRGVPGIVVAAAVGCATSLIHRRMGTRMAGALSGAIGGAVAALFAIATAEVTPPGTLQWAIQGGKLGLLIGLPAAVIAAGLFSSLTRLDR